MGCHTVDIAVGKRTITEEKANEIRNLLEESANRTQKAIEKKDIKSGQ